MTDKELIKQEIERRIVQAEEFAERAKGANDDSSKLSWDFVATQNKSLLQFIDSIPEEPTVKGITWEDVNTLESLIYQVHNEYPSIGEKSFGLEVLERFQDCQDDIEEPASEDLEEAMELSVNEEPLLEFFATGQPTIGAYGKDSLRNQFEAGAEWQKQKDQETIELAEDHAMLAGMNKMKEEMMKDAVEGKVQCGYGDGNKLSIKAMLPQDSDLKYADKVKVLILKTE